MSAARVLTGTLLGAAGGAVAEIVDLIFRISRDRLPGQPPPPLEPWRSYVLGMLLGLFIGAAIGMTEGLYSGSRSRFWRALLFGAIGGMVCGYVGIGLGEVLYAALGGNPYEEGIFIQQVLARAAGWGLMGLFLGALGGAPGLSVPRMRNGAVGGLIGGLVGGFLFQVLDALNLFMGFQLRLVGFGLLGAAIGFFVGLVGEVFKQAWVKVLVGRNEGREHVIDPGIATIGRDELADVPIFLDRTLAPRHASIRYANGRYHLYDEAGRGDTRWRGQPVAAGQGVPLTDGDLIQLGRVTLVFYEKATATAATRSAAAGYAPAAAPGAPVAAGVCEFCGQPRDPATGACACSVGAPPSGAYAPAAPSPTLAAGAAAPTVYGPPPAENPFAPYMQPEPAPAWPAGAPAPAAAPSGAGPRLVAIDGPYTGQVFPIIPPAMSIGRETDRTLVLVGDTTASRRHATITTGPAGYVLRDDGSANGTYVNGQPITEQLLYPGAEIRIGSSTFRFEL